MTTDAAMKASYDLWQAEIDMVRPFFTVARERCQQIMRCDMRGKTGNPKAVLRVAVQALPPMTDEHLLRTFVDCCRIQGPDGKTSIDLIREWQYDHRSSHRRPHRIIPGLQSLDVPGRL